MLSFVSHKCGTHGVNSNCWPKYGPNDTVRFVCGVCVFVSGLPLLFSHSSTACEKCLVIENKGSI